MNVLSVAFLAHHRVLVGIEPLGSAASTATAPRAVRVPAGRPAEPARAPHPAEGLTKMSRHPAPAAEDWRPRDLARSPAPA